MKGYILAEIEVKDQEKYAKYIAATPAVIRKYGGRFLIRGGEPVVLEGSTVASRVVLVEFPSPEKARQFYYSPEYQQVRRLRTGAAQGLLIALSGVETKA